MNGSVQQQQFQAKDTIIGQLYRYKVKGILGHGAISQVLLGTIINEAGQEQYLVAIKLLRSVTFIGNQENKYFFQEKDIVRKLSKERDDHIVNIIEVIETSAEYLIVMEYCENGSLLDHIYVETPNWLKVVLNFSTQLAKGIQFLHSHGIAHRDLKPENIFIHSMNGQYVLKIGDYGLGKNDQIYMMKSCIGTINYMAPEMINKQEYDFKVDTWALGCIMHELIAGEQLFAGCSILEISTQIRKMTHYECISGRFGNLISRCLQPIPAKRIAIQELTMLLFQLYDDIAFNRTTEASQKLVKFKNFKQQQKFTQQQQFQQPSQFIAPNDHNNHNKNMFYNIVPTGTLIQQQQQQFPALNQQNSNLANNISTNNMINNSVMSNERSNLIGLPATLSVNTSKIVNPYNLNSVNITESRLPGGQLPGEGNLGVHGGGTGGVVTHGGLNDSMAMTESIRVFIPKSDYLLTSNMSTSAAPYFQNSYFKEHLSNLHRKETISVNPPPGGNGNMLNSENMFSSEFGGIVTESVRDDKEMYSLKDQHNQMQESNRDQDPPKNNEEFPVAQALGQVERQQQDQQQDLDQKNTKRKNEDSCQIIEREQAEKELLEHTMQKQHQEQQQLQVQQQLASLDLDQSKQQIFVTPPINQEIQSQPQQKQQQQLEYYLPKYPNYQQDYQQQQPQQQQYLLANQNELQVIQESENEGSQNHIPLPNEQSPSSSPANNNNNFLNEENTNQRYTKTTHAPHHRSSIDNHIPSSAPSSVNYLHHHAQQHHASSLPQIAKRDSFYEDEEAQFVLMHKAEAYKKTNASAKTHKIKKEKDHNNGLFNHTNTSNKAFNQHISKPSRPEVFFAQSSPSHNSHFTIFHPVLDQQAEGQNHSNPQIPDQQSFYQPQQQQQQYQYRQEIIELPQQDQQGVQRQQVQYYQQGEQEQQQLLNQQQQQQQQYLTKQSQLQFQNQQQFSYLQPPYQNEQEQHEHRLPQQQYFNNVSALNQQQQQQPEPIALNQRQMQPINNTINGTHNISDNQTIPLNHVSNSQYQLPSRTAVPQQQQQQQVHPYMLQPLSLFEPRYLTPTATKNCTFPPIEFTQMGTSADILNNNEQLQCQADSIYDGNGEGVQNQQPQSNMVYQPQQGLDQLGYVQPQHDGFEENQQRKQEYQQNQQQQQQCQPQQQVYQQHYISQHD